MTVLGTFVSDCIARLQRFPQILDKVVRRLKVFFLDSRFIAGVFEILLIHHELALVFTLPTLDAGQYAAFIQIKAGTLHAGAMVLAMLHLGF